MHCHRLMFLKNTEWTPVHVTYYTSVRLYDTVHRCVYMNYMHHKNTNTNYKSRCICAILSTGAFMWVHTPVHLYDLWAPQKYQYELEKMVPLSDTAHQCISITWRIGALRRPMGTAQIPRLIRTTPCIVSPTLRPGAILYLDELVHAPSTTPSHLLDDMHRCVDTLVAHRWKKHL